MVPSIRDGGAATSSAGIRVIREGKGDGHLTRSLDGSYICKGTDPRFRRKNAIPPTKVIGGMLGRSEVRGICGETPDLETKAVSLPRQTT